MARENITRMATIGAGIIAVVVVVLLLVTGGSTYVVNAQFQDAGQLVSGDLVTVAGHTVGSVGTISITSNGLANVELKISDKSIDPLSSNTTATIGQLSLTGITNRFVSLAPGVGGSHIESNGTLSVANTKGIVDLDSVLDAFTPQVRKSLQQFLKTGAYFVGGTTASQLNQFSQYLNPALSQISNFGAEVVSDKFALDRLIGSTARFTAPLAAETTQIQGSVDNTASLFGEISSERSALQDGISRAPAVLKQVTDTFGRVDTTLKDLDPTLVALKPAAPKLASLLTAVVPFAQNLKPTVADFQTLLGEANTSLKGFVPAAKTAEPALTALVSALGGITPILSGLRPYVPDFVAGFFNGVGGSTGAGYDANGNYLHVRLAASGSAGSLAGVLSLLGNTLNGVSGGNATFGNTKPCPGGGTIPSADGSAPWNDPDSYAARVEATITGPFQFHTDATCIIRPDGLIAENYLDCDPGSSSKPLLKSSGGFPPTVPVNHTSEPVSLLDLFNIFNVPTSERFQAVVDELGIATAGNGDQINSIIQRANPTLQSAQRVISILDSQTSNISTAIDATDQVAKAGSAHIDDVQAFINQAKGLTQLTSDHSSSLEQAINKLPGFLAASTPALADLNTVAKDGTPLLANLRTAVPYLTKVNNQIVPFSNVAEPALASVSKAISTAIPDTKAVTPVVSTLSHYLAASSGTTAQFSKLLTNLIQHGFSENFLSVLYYTATALAKHDSDSHMLSSLLLFPGSGLCGTYATTPAAACNAHYGAASAYTPERAKTPSQTSATTATTSTTAASTTTTATTATTATPTTTNPISSLGSGLSNLGSTVSSGVSSVLNGVGGTVNKITSGLSGGKSSDSSSQTSTTSLQNLLGYLLK